MDDQMRRMSKFFQPLNLYLRQQAHSNAILEILVMNVIRLMSRAVIVRDCRGEPFIYTEQK
jgi:hypothetical protein